MWKDPKVTVADVLFVVCAVTIAAAFSLMGVSIVTDDETSARRFIAAAASFFKK